MSKRWTAAASLGLLFLLIVLYLASPAFQRQVDEGYQALASGEQARVADWVSRFDPWGPLVIALAMTAQMFLIVVPSVVLLVVSVVAYGPWTGTLVGLGSVLTASAAGYAVGAGLGPLTVDRMIGESKKESLEEAIDRYGMWTVVVFRMSPILSNDAISFIGGMLRMGFVRFLGATAVGILPLLVLIAYLGKSTDEMTTMLLWLSGVSALALVAYIVYDRR